MQDEHRTAFLLQTVASELRDVTRLFRMDPALWEETHQPHFIWHAWEEDGRFHCRFALGQEEHHRESPIPACEDARIALLEQKRALKRLCKQTLYDLCKRLTGVTPPWGSLTGIRPTRLVYEAMEHGLSLEAACAQVGEIFDVSPEKRQLLRDIMEVQSTLPPPCEQEMDVYVGIPFCTTRCAYCTFLSGELGKGKLVEPYLAALFREMAAGADILARSGRKLRAVYVGGGTPTALNADQLQRLTHMLMKLFPGAVEYTVEAGRPDTLTREKLEIIRDAGVARISINPQTMNDRTLEVIGRRHTVAQVYDAYAMARQVGFHHINMDVIAGLPGEDLTDFARTMAGARELSPESLTVHTLAIKRSSRLHLEHAPLPPAELAAEMVRMGHATAAELGMRPYYLYRQKNMAGNQENVGYALPGHACQYNVDIMEETTHILALGAGGISKRIYPDQGRIEREPNVSNIEQYIARVDEMVARKERLFLGAGPAGHGEDGGGIA